MNHYFLISASDLKFTGGSAPPLENFSKNFPMLNRRELYSFYQKSLQTANRDAYRFVGCRGNQQKYWLDQWNGYLTNLTLTATDRFDCTLFQGLKNSSKFFEDIWILCPFHGLIEPNELLPSYNLRPDAFLPGCGFLIDYWVKILAGILAERVNDGILWNLLKYPWPGISKYLQFESYFEIKFSDKRTAEKQRLKLIEDIRLNPPHNHYKALQFLIEMKPIQQSNTFVL